MEADTPLNARYSTRSAGVKRLMKEAAELREPTELYYAQPLEDNLFEWHFTVRGPADSDFDGGIYHGRIMFPSDYPMNPPNLILLTPNGRFELSKKICLSISGYHPETWLPSWSIRTALLALIGFMPTDPAGAVGSLDYPSAERKRLAKLSADWRCKECGLCMKDALRPLTDEGRGDEQEAKKLVKTDSAAALAPVTEKVAQEAGNGDVEAVAPADPAPSTVNRAETPGAARERMTPTRSSSTVLPPPSPVHAESSSDFTLWLLIPIIVVLVAISATLIARRAVS